MKPSDWTNSLSDTRRDLFDDRIGDQTRRYAEKSETIPSEYDEARFPPGTRISHYEIVDCVGSGGTGTVFRAKVIEKPDTFVAIKFLQSRMRCKQGLDRFEIEKQILRELNHPGIAKLIDEGMHAGNPYLVMPFIDGPQLDEALKKSIPLKVRIEWFRKICAAVAAAHERQILHRDLKPSNIIIDASGSPIVTDFGLAKSLNLPDDSPNLTTTGHIMGTPKFMAPEQTLGKSNYGMTTDVYGLGAVLYFILANRPPFEGRSFFEIGQAVQASLPKRLTPDDPEISRDLETICFKCLEKEPANRYPTAAALIDDLDCYQQGVPIAARHVSSLERLSYWVKRNPMVASLWMVIAILVIGWAITQAVALRQAQQRFVELRSRIQQLTDMGSDALQPTELRAQQRLLEMTTEMYGDLERMGSLDDQTLHDCAVEWFRLGRVHNSLGNKVDKFASYREAEDRFRILVERQPENLEYQFDIYHSLDSQNRFDEAIDVIEKVVVADEFKSRHYRAAYVNSLHRKADRLNSDSNFQMSMALTKSAMKIATEFYEDEMEEPRYRRSLGTSYFDRARSHWGMGNGEAWQQDISRSLEISRELLALEPGNVGFYSDLSLRLVTAANSAMNQSDFELAKQYVAEGDSVTDIYVQLFPEHTDALRWKNLLLELKWILMHATGDGADIMQSEADYLEQTRQWLELYPTSFTANFRFASLHSHPARKNPDLKPAQALLDAYRQGTFPTASKVGVAILAFRVGDLDLADALLTQYLQTTKTPHRFMHYASAVSALRSDLESASWQACQPNEAELEELKRIVTHGEWFRIHHFETEFERARDSLSHRDHGNEFTR